MNKFNQQNYLFLFVIVLFLSLVAFDGVRSYNPPVARVAATRAFDVGFRPNQQRSCIVGYSIVISTSSTLLAGATGQVLIQTSPDSTTWTTMMSAQSGLSAGLANPGTTGSVTVFCPVKANEWCRIIRNSIAGTPGYTTPTGTELSL